MRNAETISVSISPETFELIRASVASGEYASTAEALRDAVRVWQREREDHAERIAAIKTRVHRSVEDPRPDLSGDDVKERLEALFKAARQDPKRA